MEKLVSLDGRQIFVNQKLLNKICEKDEVYFENLLTNYATEDIGRITKIMKLPLNNKKRKVINSVEILKASSEQIKEKEIALNNSNLYGDKCEVHVFKRKNDFMQALYDRDFELNETTITPLSAHGESREVYVYIRDKDGKFILIDNY